MKAGKSLLALGLILAVSITTLSGCAPKQAVAEPTQAPQEKIALRIGFFPNITHSQALVGKADGQFQKDLGEKVSVEWKQFNAGPAEIEALFAKAVDIGYIGPGPAINGYVKSGGELQIIAGATDAGAILVSRKDLKIKGVAELSGKKVAVPQYGNTQHLSLLALLEEKGLKDTTKGGTVEILQAESPDIKTLLDSGEIDAAIVPEPWGSRLVNEVSANVILDANQIWRDGKYTTAVVVARKEFITQHPDIVEQFIKTHVELTDAINGDKTKAKATINSQIKELTQKELAPDVLDSAFDRLTVTWNPEKTSVEGFAELSFTAGFQKEKADLKDLFNLQFLNKTLKEGGKPEIQ